MNQTLQVPELEQFLLTISACCGSQVNTVSPCWPRIRRLAESADGRVWMAETTRAVRPLKRPGETATSQGISRAECESRFPDTWQTALRVRTTSIS
jgi:hypothetical protein